MTALFSFSYQDSLEKMPLFLWILSSTSEPKLHHKTQYRKHSFMNRVKQFCSYQNFSYKLLFYFVFFIFSIFLFLKIYTNVYTPKWKLGNLVQWKSLKFLALQFKYKSPFKFKVYIEKGHLGSWYIFHSLYQEIYSLLLLNKQVYCIFWEEYKQRPENIL